LKRKPQAEQDHNLAAIDDILDMARRATGAMVDKRSPKPTPAVVAQAEAEDELREAVEEGVVDDNLDGKAQLADMRKDGPLKRANDMADEVTAGLDERQAKRRDFLKKAKGALGEEDAEPAPPTATPEGDSGEDWAKKAVEKYQAKHAKR
jgi:hypothetical protein